MNALRELQHRFADGLSARAADGVVDRIAGAAEAAAERFAVYANNYYVSLMDALAAVYPVVERLLGEACFRQVGRRYVATHHSPSGNVHDFGEQLGAFLAETPELAGLPYLRDVAELEWAYHRVFHAPGARPELSLERLAALPAERLAGLRFRLHPATRLLASPYPVLRIWEANQPDAEAPGVISLDQGGDRVLVLRPALEVQLAALSPGEYRLLQSLHDGASLMDAFDRATAAEPGFDLPAALARAVGSGVLLGWHLTDHH